MILAANNIENLRLLATLTEQYCANTKTKLLPVFAPRHQYLVHYAKIVNPVTIDSTPVEFVNETEYLLIGRLFFLLPQPVLPRATGGTLRHH